MAPEIDGETPGGLAGSGAALWRSITADYELERHEEAVLLQACRTVDVLDRLAAELAGAGSLVTEGRKGDPVAHPAAVEQRQQSLALARLLASLRIPTGDEAERPQRRGAARGPQQWSRRAELKAAT